MSPKSPACRSATFWSTDSDGGRRRGRSAAPVGIAPAEAAAAMREGSVDVRGVDEWVGQFRSSSPTGRKAKLGQQLEHVGVVAALRANGC